MSTAKSIVDALATDLNNNANLGTHSTVKYRRPRAILPADCPLLVVWLQSKSPTPVTTEFFDGEISIGISWHVESVQEALTLQNDEATATALIDALEKVEGRIRYLAKNGLGVGAAWDVRPGESLYLPPEMAQGLTEGYAQEAIVTVTEN